MSIAPIRPNSRFLIFGSPLIRDAEIEEIVATLRSGWIGTGPKVAQFEKEFAAYKNAHHVAALNSCTAGLHLSLLAAGIGSGVSGFAWPKRFARTLARSTNGVWLLSLRGIRRQG